MTDMSKLVKPTEEENKELMKIVEKYGYCTTWDIFQEYGIQKQKTCRAIRAGKLLAFMKNFVDKYGREGTHIRWYIVKNQAFDEFVAKNRIK